MSQRSFLSVCAEVKRRWLRAVAGLAAIALPTAALADATAGPGEIVAAASDRQSVTVVGPCQVNKPQAGAQGSGETVIDFAVWNKAGNGDRKVIVAPQLPADGMYQVWIRWANQSRNWQGYAKSVPIRIEHASGVTEFQFTQQVGNRWVNLGTYTLRAGRHTVLQLSNTGTFGLANFIAAKFVPVTESANARRVNEAPSPARDGMGTLNKAICDHQIAIRYGRGDAETDPDALRKADDAEREARFWWDTMLTSPDRKGVWQDTVQESWGLTREATRLCALSAAYAGATGRVGCDLRGNPELLRDIIEGLRTLAVRYNAATPWGVNWWDFEIGVPEQILPALCLLGDAAPAELRKGFLAAVEHFTADPGKYYNKGFVSTGANRLWLCRVHIYRGALERAADRVILSRNAVIEPLRYVARNPKDPDKAPDGFYADGSFIQHGGIAYTAAYGFLLLDCYADVATLLKDTPWKVSDPAAANAYEVLGRCLDPFVVRGETVATVIGRSMGAADYESNNNAAYFALTAVKLLPCADVAQASGVKSLLKKWLGEESSGALLATAVKQGDPLTVPVLKAIAADSTIVPAKSTQGLEVCAGMDRAMYRTGPFAAALAMNSTRMLTYETLWGANRRGWFASEGMLLWYTPDVERYRDGYFAIVDPYRLPGITVERFARNQGDGGGGTAGKRGGGSFVGGASLGAFGIAAMHVKPLTGALEARKSWFFFGDQIVNLGAGIGANSENIVETTIENARLVSPEQQLEVNDRKAPDGAAIWKGATWAYLASSRPGAGMGWALLSGNADLHTLVEARTGSRADVQKNCDATPITLRFATLWFDHGSNSRQGSYAYVTLPGRSKEDVSRYAGDPAVSVLANTAEVQAVSLPSESLVAASIWTDQEVTFPDMTCRGKSLVIAQDTAGEMRLAVADPTQQGGEVRISYKAAVRRAISKDDAVTVESLNPLRLVINVRAAGGRTLRAAFEK